ncbi:MAG: leucine-rich repeat protein [Lachnospiraceae bacterium]|nr:leucine-rich repeat protein [Lachnospiraceae bacterium]
MTATGDTYQIVLSWGISKEADTETYYIYRRSEDETEYTRLAEITGRSVQSYTDEDIVADKKYYYYVTGVNFFGQEGEASRTVVAAATSDTEAPTVVQLTPANSTVIGGETTLYARATDNIQVAEIRLSVSTDGGDTWTEIGSSEAESIKMTLSMADYADGTIQVKAVAVDAADNESDALTRTYTVDNTGPAQVTGLSGVSTATTVTLSWDAVEDADFSFFRVEQLVDGEYVKVQDVSSTLGVNLYNLQANTEYTYRVAAYDRLGNRGEASESVTVATQEDTTAPVITAIGPDAGYYNGEIALQITATDNLGIASVQIQTSANGIIWEDYKTVSYEDGGTSETVSETISLDEQDELGNYVYAEGYLYIRGIATDTSGNESESGTSAPYTQYIVDRTAPDVPEGLTADASSGAVVLCWEGNGDADFAGMRIFRSTDGETWDLLAEGLSSKTYTDRSTEPAQTYQYYLQAADAAGNISEASASVTCTMPEDTEAPQILSVSPASGSVIGASNTTFRVLVSDNWRVKTVRATYTVNDDSDSEYTLVSETDIENYYKLASGEIPVADLQDGDVLTVTVTVTDAAGHETVSGTETVYTIDRTAPQVTEVAADGADGVIRVTWSGWAESDLSGYRIYRRTEDGMYSLVAQKSAEDGEENRSDGSTGFLYEDSGAAENETYYYKVEAVDLCGNTSSCESDAAWVEAELSVTASVSCDSTLQWDKEYVFDASASAADCGIVSYTFNFGDGSEPVSGTAARVTHTYTKSETDESEDTSAENEDTAQEDSDDGTTTEEATEGTYTLTLTVTDAEGNTASVTKTLTVADESLLGTAEITIVDENGDAISGVPVYFDMEHTTENIARTNVDGIASFTAEAGRYTVGAYDSGYLPVTRQVTVAAGETATLTITMTAQEIVSGEFEVNRMTLDEIVAAGFDVNDPANQNVVRVTLHLTYGSEPLDTEIYLFDGEGSSQATVTTSDGKRNLSVALWIEDDSTDDDDDKGPGSNWTVTFGDGSSGSESMAIAILDVPVEASYLKEFFDVKFYLFNNASSSFELVNNVVSLDLPEGLTLMNEGGACDDAEVTFDSLSGQTGKTIEWILRGDQAGEYDLTASYSGVLSQFDTMVSALFQTEDPITVYGLDAIRLIAEINSTIAWGGLYFSLSLQNVGGADIYLPQLNVVGDIVNTYESYTDGDDTETTEETRSVTLLNTVYENASGYSQYLGTDETLNALAVGETYTRKYACYSAVTESDLEYLHSAVAEVADEYGIEVEIRIVDMNLYSTEDADEILASVSYSGETHDAYTYFTTNGNFNYYTYAEMSDQDFLGLCGEMLYGTKEALLDQDLDYFTGDDIKELTREYICEMLSDDSFQEAVDTQVDLTYLKVVKSVLGEISTVLGQSGEASVNDLINTTLSETATQMHLAMQLKTAGVDGFMDSLEKIGFSAAKLSIKALLLQDGEDVNDFFADSFGKVVSGFGDAIGLLNDAGTAWVTSVEITNQFITISAAREQAEYVLTVLLEQMTGYGELEAIENLLSQIGSTAADSGLTSFEQDVVEELWDIYQSLEEGFATQEEVFVQELLKTEATSLTYKYVAKGLQKAFGVSSSAWNVVYIGLKVGSKIIDKMIGAEETIDQIRSLRVAAIMTRALWGGVREAYYAGESIDWALSLKYLIKMRLIGEQAWVTFNTEAKTEKATDLDSGREYELDEYYIVFKEKVLSYRDILFGQSVTVLNVPEAPTVTVDYANETTAEAFDDSYEYSFDGVYWTYCDGSTIALEPGTVGKYLWIRVAETSESYCGNTTKLYIPARPALTGDVLAVYGGGTYSFSGLTADVYCVFTDSEGGEMTPILLTVTDGCASLEGYAYASSVQLYYAGTASSFAGSVKELSVYYTTDEWTVTPDEDYDYTYDGTEKTPGITVKNADGDVLTPENDYTVTYTDNINAGTATITVTGCGNYSGTVTQTFTIDKASQTISGTDSYPKTYGDGAFTLDAKRTAGDGALTYAGSDTSVVTVDETGKVTIKGAGTATITVTAKGTDNYEQAEKTIAITVVKASQTISGTASYTKTYGTGTFNLDAKRTAGDGALTYASSDEDVVKVSSAGVITIQGAGSAVITITAAETDNYMAAELSVTITVVRASQTVSGTDSYSRTYGDAAFTLDAKTSGDGTLSYASSDEDVVKVSSAGVVTIQAAGSAIITVTAKASTNYNESAAKTITITVAKASQTVTATAASSSIKVDTTTLITASGTGTITYTSSDTSVATVNSSGKVTAKAKGTATITVKAAGNSNYNAGTKTVSIKVTALVKGDTFTAGSVKYKLTSASAVTVTGLSSKTATSAKIPATVTYGGVTYSVKAISASAFSGYTKLKTVSVGSKVTSIGSKAFYKCTALTKVTGCAAVTSVGSSAFQSCSKLATVAGLQKATTIGSKAFYGCTKIKTIGSTSGKITLAKVKTIGSSAFYKCTTLTYVNLTSTVLTKIDTSAFQGCTALKTFVSKSTKLTTIGKKAFYGDKKLASVTLKTTKLTSSKVGASAFKGIKSTCTFKVPSAKVSAYKKIFKAKGASSKITVKKG